MQLALCKVLFPRLRGQSVCPSTFSVLLMMWEMFSVEYKRTSSPSHSSECDSQKWIGWGHMLAGKGVEEVLTCPFHLPVNINGEEGNHCHSSRYSTKPPDCILDSDMLYFFPTGKPNVLAQRDWLIAWLPKKTSIHPSTPLPMFLNPTPALPLSLSLSLSVCTQMD